MFFLFSLFSSFLSLFPSTNNILCLVSIVGPIYHSKWTSALLKFKKKKIPLYSRYEVHNEKINLNKILIFWRNSLKNVLLLKSSSLSWHNGSHVKISQLDLYQELHFFVSIISFDRWMQKNLHFYLYFPAIALANNTSRHHYLNLFLFSFQLIFYLIPLLQKIHFSVRSAWCEHRKHL